ncbi:MAG: RDD family protein [Acidiferrobacterales bacterium]|nr:RDD family protein [Acidiferrobacterales bacterium]
MHNPGFIKRLLVVVYDGLLFVAVAMITSALLMGMFMFVAPDSFFVDPATLDNPKMIELSQLGRNVGGLIVTLNCLAMSFIFYGWFWTHGGQTLGMRAWNLYLIKPDGKFIDWQIAFKRYCAALLSWVVVGLGFAWILLSNRNLAWHDLLSNTRIVFVPKEKQPNKNS